MLVHEDFLALRFPADAREGTWVRIEVERIAAPGGDPEEPRRRLGARDPGGDIEL